MRKLHSIVLVSALIVSISTYATDFKAHHSQKPSQYHLDIDRVNMPYKDTLNDPNGSFTVEDFIETEGKKSVHRDEWDNEAKEFTGEDFYTVLIAGKNHTVSSSNNPSLKE